MPFEADPHKLALCCGDVQLTFGQLDARVDALASRLADHPGIVAVCAHNRVGPALVMVAALRAGRPVALLSPAWTASELMAARALLGRAVQVDGAGEVVWQVPDRPASHHPDTAVILFTSGSTGRPQAVQISRSHLEQHLCNVIESVDLRQAREQAVFVPLSHAFGALAQWLPGLRAGLTTHLFANVAVARSMIEQGQAGGVWSGVPAHWEALLRYCRPGAHKVARITHIVSAGAPLSQDLRRRLAERFSAATLYNAYGQSEAGPRLVCLSSQHPRFFSDASGLPVPGVSLKLGADDELCVQGRLVMLGYLGAPEATAERIRDGWLHTGDAARIDPDGVVTVLGRLDDVRKVGGERISLIQVDHALRRLQGVEDAAATVEEDDIYGERLIAFLVGGADLARRRCDDLRAEMASSLAWPQVPRAFYLVEALPRSHSGKLQRRRLAALRRAARVLE